MATSKPAFMARLPESRLRKLPPLSPIRERSTPGATPDTASREVARKPQATTSSHRNPQQNADVLFIEDFPEEYRYLVTDNGPVASRHKTQSENLYPYVRPAENDKWRPEQIDEVVNQYLQTSTLVLNPQLPQPSAVCKCCTEINSLNRKHLLERRTHPHLHDNTHPNNPLVSSKSNEVLPASVYSADIGMFRTESPELLSDSTQHKIPEYEDTLLDKKTVFVTQPAKKMLYSRWGVQQEVDAIAADRKLAENVVEASSNFITAMDRLRKFGHDD